MLCRGRVVVSDRLHASLLALLMGRPFVGLDNIYGKMGRVRELLFRPRPGLQANVTADMLDSHVVSSEEEVVARVVTILREQGRDFSLVR